MLKYERFQTEGKLQYGNKYINMIKFVQQIESHC